MSSFTKAVILKKTCGKYFIVYEQFSYYVGNEENNELITIPKGFETDGASIPRIFTPFVGNPMDEFLSASVVHDFLYSKQGVLTDAVYTRKECDDIFREAMGILGVSKWKRNIMYRAVRLGGWKPWGGYKFLPKISKKGITFRWSKDF